LEYVAKGLVSCVLSTKLAHHLSTWVHLYQFEIIGSYTDTVVTMLWLKEY